jgi:hypothetical protein
MSDLFTQIIAPLLIVGAGYAYIALFIHGLYLLFDYLSKYALYTSLLAKSRPAARIIDKAARYMVFSAFAVSALDSILRTVLDIQFSALMSYVFGPLFLLTLLVVACFVVMIAVSLSDRAARSRFKSFFMEPLNIDKFGKIVFGVGFIVFAIKSIINAVFLIINRVLGNLAYSGERRSSDGFLSGWGMSEEELEDQYDNFRPAHEIRQKYGSEYHRNW